MRKKIEKMIIISLACLLSTAHVERAFASTIEEIRQQQEENRQQLNNVEGQISGLEGRQEDIGAEIDALDEDLVQIIASVDMIQEDIAEKEGQIRETEAEYEVAKQQEEEQYAAMKLRIKFMYEQGNSSYMQMLFDSQSFGEMVNKADYIAQIYEYDRRMLEEYQAAKEYVQQVWDQLEEEKSELEVFWHELEQEQAYMEGLLEEKRQEYNNYDVQIARARQEAAAYKTKIKQQTAQIRKLEEEARKKAEEEARRKAEEEARRKAEEEERRRREAEASGNTDAEASGTSSETTSSGSTASDNATETDPGTSQSQDPPPEPEVTVPSGGSSKGQEIANYACQFIGNPYVAGGTSLTQGADCSGFVWRVFKDKGYSVPRTSWELRNVGTEVAYANAQPGDIVCYAGHVGIYIGNGNIVHASTPKSGIKVSHATYKTILTVRRVV